MATKRTYHVIVPATGETIEYTTTGKEYAFAAIVNFPREEGTYWSGEKWVSEGGWGIVKKSATEKGASAIGQTKRHSEYLKSLPHAVVPIFHGPAPVVEQPAVEEAPAEPVAEEAPATEQPLIAHTSTDELETYIYRGKETVAVITAETTFTNDKTSALRLEGWEVDGEWEGSRSVRKASVKQIPITEVPIGADVRLAEADEDEAARGYIFEVKSDSKYDADPLVAVHWEDDRVTVEYLDDLTVLPTFYSYNRVLEIAGEKDADGWRHATITLREGDTAADPGSTKKGFAGRGTIEYHIHPTGLHYSPSDGVRSIYLR